MTYGWALLVVLIAISALAFFGVMNPKNSLPDQCILFAGVSCLAPYSGYVNILGTDYHILKFVFQNGLGYTMDKATIKVIVDKSITDLPLAIPALFGPLVGTEDCSPYASPTASFTLANGQAKTCGYYFQAGTYNFQPGSTLKLELEIRWTDKSGNSRIRTGSMVLAVQGK